MKIAKSIIILIVIPGVILLNVFLYQNKQYDIISIIIAILACLPFFLTFEKKKPEPKELVLIAAFTTITVLSRLIFIPIPGFKPVTAILIIIGIVFGKEIGFMVGALTAVLSNVYFGQGPWTPFQMFSWGIIGYLAGMFRNILKDNTFLILLFGAFSGVLFSLLMDFHSVLMYDNAFRLKRYLGVIGVSLPVTLEYIISNMIFLLIFGKPLIAILDRIRIKYHLYQL